jgi:hypothetical protein
VRGAGNTVASYASTVANGTSVSAMAPACGASGGGDGAAALIGRIGTCWTLER